MTRQIKVAIIGDASKLEQALGRAGKAGGKLGKALKIGVGAGAAAATGAVAGSIKIYADFDDKLQKSVAIMGDVSDAMRVDMSNAAREVGKTTKFSAKDAAESYFFLASAGLDAKQSIAALPQVAAFAQAGNFDMARATDLLTDAQSALGLTSKDTKKNLENMARVSDVLVKANTLANASVEQFSESLTNKAGAALKVLGKGTVEGVAVLAVFADQGLKGAAAGEALDIVLRDLQVSSLKNTKEFKALGISVFDSKGEMRNTGKIIGQLEGALDGMSDKQVRATLSTLGFQDQSISNIQTLLGSSKAIGRYEKQLRKAGGTTKDVADKQLKSFSGQLALLKGKVADVGLEIGSRLVPTLLRLVDWVQTNWPQIQAVFQRVFAAMKTVWETVLKPALEQARAGFEFVVAWVRDNWPQIQAVFQRVFAAMKTVWETVLKPALEQARAGFEFVVAWVRDNWDQIRDVAEDVFGAIAKIVNNQLLPALRTTVNIARTVVNWYRDHLEIALPLTAAIGGMAAAVALWNIATKVAAVSTAAWAAVQAVLNVVMTANPIGLVVVAIAGLVAGLVVAWQTSETFRNIVGGAWEAVKRISLQVWEKIKEIVVGVIAKLKEAWQRFGPTIIALARNAFNTIKSVIKAAMQVIQGVIDVVMGLIRGDWGRAWDGIKGIVGGVVNAIKAIITGQLGQLKILMQSLGKKMLQGITSGLKGIGSKIKTSLLVPIKNKITGFFGGAFAKANDLAAKIIGGIKSGLTRIFATMIGFVTDILSAIADAFSQVFSAALSLGKAIIDGIQSGFVDRLSWLRDQIQSGLNWVWEGVRKPWKIFNPSRRSADELGKPLAEGVIVGLLTGLGPLPEKFGAALTKAIEHGRAGDREVTGRTGQGFRRRQRRSAPRLRRANLSDRDGEREETTADRRAQAVRGPGMGGRRYQGGGCGREV